MNIKQQDREAVRARIGVFGLFFLLGLTVGFWASGLPGLDERLDLGPGRLGTVLLLVSFGALVSMILAGRLVDRVGSRVVSVWGGPACSLLLIGPALASSYAWLAGLAVLFGVGIGALEVGMNTHSVEVERRYGRPIISAFHGVWSLGGAVGGAVTALVLKMGVDGQALLIGAALVVPFLYPPVTRLLLPKAAPVDTGAAGGTGLGTMRWGLILVLGVAAFASHLAEGAAMDWAAVHARWVLDADPALAPIAYTIFSVAMTAVRLLGDPIRARLGGPLTLRVAGLLATAGWGLVLGAQLLPQSWQMASAWTGWALAGAGLATVVPVIFSAVGASGDAVGRALATVTAFGYTGLLAGPAILGFVAEATSLPVALIIPACFALIIALAGAPGVRALTTQDGEKVAASAERGL